MPGQRWYPTKQQLMARTGESPDKHADRLERAFRQVLLQHYTLSDKVDELHAKVVTHGKRST
jgi:hypothetical protein